MNQIRTTASRPRRIPRSRSIPAVTAIILLVAPNAPLYAEDDLLSRSMFERLVDAANPYASARYVYDSNLFRMDDDEASSEGRSDHHASITAGFDSTLELSRQQIQLSGNIYREQYDTYDELDYTGGRASAMWNWSAGSKLTGTAGYQYQRYLMGFANRTVSKEVRDIRSEDKYLASIAIDLPRHWQTIVRGSFSDISFTENKALELERLLGGVALNYVSRAGNIIGLDVEVINGDYDIVPARDFDEYTIGPTLTWQLTSSTQLTGKVGYTNRDVRAPSESDYDDITGRIVLKKRAADRDQLTVAIWRELSNLGDEIADFALIHGISIEPRWELSEALALRLFASYEDRDFEGVGGDSNRQDDVLTGGVFADWTITPNISVSVGYNAQTRSSTRIYQDYDSRDIQLQITGRL